MLAFKDIELADREVILSYTLPSGRRSCDLSFANLMSWRGLFASQWTLWGGFLLLKWRLGRQSAYTLPVGQGDLRAVLSQLKDDARHEGMTLRLTGICEEMVDEVERAMPGRLTFRAERDYADYVYLRQDLATLSGRRLQAKRNHVHQFIRACPDWRYEPITPDHIGECLQLEAAWYEANPTLWHEGADEERQAVTFALRHFSELGLTGGLLRTGGRIVAFTFGMPISTDTFGVHAEKADAGVEGAYAMINHEFAQRIPQQYIYVNREEDMGLEGLRKAKLSYHPAMLLSKYMAVENADT